MAQYYMLNKPRGLLTARRDARRATVMVCFPEELRARQTPCGLQLLGCRDGVEGFFIARMRRVR